MPVTMSEQEPVASSSGAECYLILHSVSKRHNIGTLLRSCTAFGVKQVRRQLPAPHCAAAAAIPAGAAAWHSIPRPCPPDLQVCLVGSRQFNAFGSQGTVDYVPMRHFATLEACVQHLKEVEGCTIIGEGGEGGADGQASRAAAPKVAPGRAGWCGSLLLWQGTHDTRPAVPAGVEIDPAAAPVQHHPFRGNTAFMLGNEGQGMSDKQMRLCDAFVYIPQHGAGTASLNVTVAGGVCGVAVWGSPAALWITSRHACGHRAPTCMEQAPLNQCPAMPCPRAGGCLPPAASIVLHHFAIWAGFAERGRSGAKFVVGERPEEARSRPRGEWRGWRGCGRRMWPAACSRCLLHRVRVAAAGPASTPPRGAAAAAGNVGAAGACRVGAADRGGGS